MTTTTADVGVRVALERLIRELRSRILGLPDHPWIPGGRFADGALIAALEDAETALALATAVGRCRCRDDPHGDRAEELRRRQAELEAEYPEWRRRFETPQTRT